MSSLKRLKEGVRTRETYPRQANVGKKTGLISRHIPEMGSKVHLKIGSVAEIYFLSIDWESTGVIRHSASHMYVFLGVYEMETRIDET